MKLRRTWDNRAESALIAANRDVNCSEKSRVLFGLAGTVTNICGPGPQQMISKILQTRLKRVGLSGYIFLGGEIATFGSDTPKPRLWASPFTDTPISTRIRDTKASFLLDAKQGNTASFLAKPIVIISFHLRENARFVHACCMWSEIGKLILVSNSRFQNSSLVLNGELSFVFGWKAFWRL